MNIVLIGKPGAGKGFISSYLQEKYDFAHISTGNLLRKHIENKTDIGIIVKDVINKGELVSDGLILDILKYELKDVENYNNYIFDGFPRTLFQAKMLDELTQVDYVIYVDCKDDIILKRLSERKVCLKCGKTSLNSNKADVCEFCNSKLSVRDDDKPETVINRISTFNQISKPLFDYYNSKNILKIVDNSGTKEETIAQLEKILEQF